MSFQWRPVGSLKDEPINARDDGAKGAFLSFRILSRSIEDILNFPRYSYFMFPFGIKKKETTKTSKSDNAVDDPIDARDDGVKIRSLYMRTLLLGGSSMDKPANACDDGVKMRETIKAGKTNSAVDDPIDARDDGGKLEEIIPTSQRNNPVDDPINSREDRAGIGLSPDFRGNFMDPPKTPDKVKWAFAAGAA